MEHAAPMHGHARRFVAGLAATAICAVNLAIVPVAVTSSPVLAADPPAPAMTPIDPQNWQDQQTMTWADYHAIPGHNWADPALVPGVRSLKIALVAVDMPDQPFVITMPKGSDAYGNPQIDPVARADVPAFYRNFLITPSAVNHYQTINGYWMEQSRGQVGITQIDAYGPYQLPKNLYQYGLNEYNQNSFSRGTNACPAQTAVNGTQTGVNTVEVGSSAFFYPGDIATFSSISPSGTKVIAAVPDATHLTLATTTLGANALAGASVLRLASLSGLTIGDAITVDPGVNAEAAVIAGIGSGSGSTSLGLPATAGDTAVKVASVSGFAVGDAIYVGAGSAIESATVAAVGTAGATTVRVAPAAGDTTLFVQSRSGFAAGDTITIDAGAALETRVVQSTATNSSGGGQRIVLTTPLANAHDVGAQVSGSGISLAAGLALDHASGDGVFGTGIALAAPLVKSHLSGYGLLDPSATAGAVNVNNAVTIHDCTFNMDTDTDAVWRLNEGATISSGYDVILRIYAGYDETSVWQEFGEMMFQTKEDIPRVPWGNPNPALPNWATTRYVDWTSWKAAQEQWGLSSVRQGESSGTITHELSHFLFSIGDNNNNPYITPYHRVGSGPWDIMDRGSFNGPGGPHNRWEVPAQYGASMPAGHMLRDKIGMKFVTYPEVLRLNRTGLAQSGLAVADDHGARVRTDRAEPRRRAGHPRRGRPRGLVQRQHGSAVRRRRLEQLFDGGCPAHRLRLVHARQRHAHRQEQAVPLWRQLVRGLHVRLQLLHVGDRRAPRGHRSRRLRTGPTGLPSCARSATTVRSTTRSSTPARTAVPRTSTSMPRTTCTCMSSTPTRTRMGSSTTSWACRTRPAPAPRRAAWPSMTRPGHRSATTTTRGAPSR